MVTDSLANFSASIIESDYLFFFFETFLFVLELLELNMKEFSINRPPSHFSVFTLFYVLQMQSLLQLVILTVVLE